MIAFFSKYLMKNVPETISDAFNVDGWNIWIQVVSKNKCNSDTPFIWKNILTVAPHLQIAKVAQRTDSLSP